MLVLSLLSNNKTCPSLFILNQFPYIISDVYYNLRAPNGKKKKNLVHKHKR